jgi:hypothetical protein
MADKTNMLISDVIVDKTMRKYLYLDLSIDELIDEMENLKMENIGDESLVPFTAKIRGYIGAQDQDGSPWLLKEIEEEEGAIHKIQEIAYYVDFLLKTPAAPTVLLNIEGHLYRATKHIKNAMQIGSYNYLEEPFIKMLANDLVNRWLFFDEDRNPNNYLVVHDSDSNPFIVVIDYNKADLETTEMKIYGNNEKFGWHREEKTRFLTLLKPDNFDTLCIEDFDQRLKQLTNIKQSTLRDICKKVFSKGIIDDVEAITELVVNNLTKRIDYLDKYFRTWFVERDLEKEKKRDDRASGLGNSFLNYYKRKS